MAVEMPVIVTPEVGLAADVARSGAGIVSSGQPVELAAAIQHLLRDRDARADMGQRGRELVQSQFTWERVAAQMEEHYLQIAAVAGP